MFCYCLYVKFDLKINIINRCGRLTVALSQVVRHAPTIFCDEGHRVTGHGGMPRALKCVACTRSCAQNPTVNLHLAHSL